MIFCFIGAVPATSWIGACLATDVGRVPPHRPRPAATNCRRRSGLRWTGCPLPYETSHPGVFAVGDVRAGSVKRVAAAVGEGSTAVRSIHTHLATLV